ncbi:uncharacterized protein LOC142237819 [Haematobia irritans]|uniref:uncharacterized protein LOC142237819 n=1 Tax=Haematobia irritans TaxID=7368 RepID=UPI003F509461
MVPVNPECFVPRQQAETAAIDERFITIGGYTFLKELDKVQEMIYCQEFQRSEFTHDADVILIQDIKNLVLYLAPSEIVTKDFVNFINTETVHSMLKALIIYFEHFLKLMEFIMIRRDETTGEKAKMQSKESTEIKRIFSAHLTQYRILLAREYSNILLGDGEMKMFYHTKPVVNISRTMKDLRFHEGFLAFCTLVVWVACHRQNFDAIVVEMNRLFRSEHFTLSRPKYKLKDGEASLLYGKNYKRCNYRAQNSPLIQELTNVDNENLPIFWIGHRKYRGNNLRISQIEYEFIVPSSQLSLLDGVTHGILGRPKKLYDTMLNIKWNAVFDEYYHKYDPYNVLVQPYLQIPKLDEKEPKTFKSFEPYYNLVHSTELWDREMLKKWIRRDAIINYFKTEGMLTTVWLKCRKEVEDTSHGPSVDEIIMKFLLRKEKMRKK